MNETLTDGDDLVKKTTNCQKAVFLSKRTKNKHFY